MTLLYCFFLIVSFAFGQQPSQPPFKIVITAEKPTIVAGSEVSINVDLTNTTNQDVTEGVMYKDGINLDSTLRFEVRDEHGKLLPKRSFPNEELRTGSVVFRTIRAGQTLTQPQAVSMLYDMQKPGKYTIQAFRRVSKDPKDDIKSNIVTVTITAKVKERASKPAKVH
jgi:hypothetical protein